MAALTEKHTKILLVVETVNMLYLLPWISTLSEEKNVAIVTTGAGIASYMSKGQPEMSDVTLVMPYMTVCEVYDKESLDAALLSSGKNYIRVPHGDTHEQIFEHGVKTEKGMGDLRDK